jgi:hypothetical protein
MRTETLLVLKERHADGETGWSKLEGGKWLLDTLRNLPGGK